MYKLTFNLPTFNGGLIQAEDIPCKGNGMTLGITEGTILGGMGVSNTPPYNLGGAAGNYGANVGVATGSFSSFPSGAKTVGITTDSTKSGIIADTSSLTLICNMIIKF